MSAISGNRCAKAFGGVQANFFRLTIATLLLGLYAHSFTPHVFGAAFSAFFLSGLIGVGVGDTAFFQTLPRLGSRLTVLIIQCLSVPIAAAIEWLWLGTRLTATQALCSGTIMLGILIALIPDRPMAFDRAQLRAGVGFGLLAALGNGFGAVLSRKAYAVAQNAGEHINGPSAAYQRVLGGLLVGLLALLVVKWPLFRQRLQAGDLTLEADFKDKWRRVWPWVITTSLAGQTLGVTCFQWALKTNPTGVVLPIVAMTPLVAIPFSHALEGERPSIRSIVGALVAVGGVIALLRIG